jgi:hypothetical protein
MSAMKEIALRAIDVLSAKHQPEFIVLYGSVVRGDYTDNSDIDVACFCEAPKVSKDVRLFEGKKLDCWIYSLSDIDPNNDEFLRSVGGELFGDSREIGKSFLSELEQRFRGGPERLPSDSRLHLIEWCKHMLDRARGEDIESRYRRTLLPCDLLAIYFQLRNRWFLGSKQSFKWLKENDRRSYGLFEGAFSDPTDLNTLAALVAATIEAQLPNGSDRTTPGC